MPRTRHSDRRSEVRSVLAQCLAFCTRCSSRSHRGTYYKFRMKRRIRVMCSARTNHEPPVPSNAFQYLLIDSQYGTRPECFVQYKLRRATNMWLLTSNGTFTISGLQRLAIVVQSQRTTHRIEFSMRIRK